VGTFANTNKLLGRFGVDGIKTGTLNGSSNLLFAARYDYDGHSVTVVGAVVGGTDHKTVDATVTTLLAGVKAGFHLITLAKKGEPFANFTTAWSQKVRAVSTKTASVLVWSNTPVTAVITALPAMVGQNAAAVGAVTFTAGVQSVRVPLALDRSLADPGPLWRVANPTLLLR
jgi:D-alanyl-D-alanine carboxypeptidase (penicillin-binding protein 5/6)